MVSQSEIVSGKRPAYGTPETQPSQTHHFLHCLVLNLTDPPSYDFRMNEENEENEDLGRVEWPTRARDFIPATHKRLPMLRLFLPFRDPDLDEENDWVRWSQYVTVQDHPASLDWYEATADIAREQPSVSGLVSCMGELDEETANALREAIGGAELFSLRWVGYGDTPRSSPSRRVFGEEFFEARLDPGDLRAGERVPEFAWDTELRLAWGSRLYPDSLIVAAQLPIFRQLMNDPRIDTASVHPYRDNLPGSAGD